MILIPCKPHTFFLKLKFENPHKHKFSKEQLFSLLRKAGFEPQQHIFANFVPPFLTESRRYLLSRSLIVKSINNGGGNWFYIQITPLIPILNNNSIYNLAYQYIIGAKTVLGRNILNYKKREIDYIINYIYPYNYMQLK